jgi:hypothetical protein
MKHLVTSTLLGARAGVFSLGEILPRRLGFELGWPLPGVEGLAKAIRGLQAGVRRPTAASRLIALCPIHRANDPARPAVLFAPHESGPQASSLPAPCFPTVCLVQRRRLSFPFGRGHTLGRRGKRDVVPLCAEPFQLLQLLPQHTTPAAFAGTLWPRPLAPCSSATLLRCRVQRGVFLSSVGRPGETYDGRKKNMQPKY